MYDLYNPLRLAKELINKSASYMEPVIQKFFNSALINGMETDSGTALCPLPPITIPTLPSPANHHPTLPSPHSPPHSCRTSQQSVRPY